MDELATTQLIQRLTDSYTVQAGLYAELAGVVGKLQSRLVLSRGDLSQVMGMFQEKQRLLETITQERARIQASADIWQEQKKAIAPSPESGRLDVVLARTEGAIREFLEIEQQIERYLMHLVEKEDAAKS